MPQFTMEDKLKARANWLMNREGFGMEDTAALLNLEYPVRVRYQGGEIRWSNRAEGYMQTLVLKPSSLAPLI